jgi:hypothetical protein
VQIHFQKAGMGMYDTPRVQLSDGVLDGFQPQLLYRGEFSIDKRDSIVIDRIAITNVEFFDQIVEIFARVSVGVAICGIGVHSGLCGRRRRRRRVDLVPSGASTREAMYLRAVITASTNRAQTAPSLWDAFLNYAIHRILIGTTNTQNWRICMTAAKIGAF